MTGRFRAAWSTTSCIYAARAARGVGDGFAAIILPAYLLEIGFDSFRSASWRPLPFWARRR
jgi:hypothetical protein